MKLKPKTQNLCLKSFPSAFDEWIIVWRRQPPEGGLTERYAKGRKPTSLMPKSLFEEAKPGVKVESEIQAHMRNWMECIRSRKPAVADIQAGYQHSIALCMTIAAMHSGRRATFDEAKQEVSLTNGKPLAPTA